ncbi:hypothetical protein [Hymenobacter ruricola]|uniref:Uncharacterized protein n=1 Tax=Hymenobacter ruricola TaxID=2791023 RepID=A0ABS0I2C8_9BACT|nr:hypothetical protein [Hymenobacter ruricola]MBF9220757.1 hypothetical protein [Hymenobacter ruricola]
MSQLQRGVLGVLLFYALGLGGTALLAQFVPVADMCNPGLPFFTGLATLVIGAGLAVVTVLAYLVGHRTAMVKGMLAAHSLLLVGITALVLTATHNG